MFNQYTIVETFPVQRDRTMVYEGECETIWKPLPENSPDRFGVVYVLKNQRGKLRNHYVWGVQPKGH